MLVTVLSLLGIVLARGILALSATSFNKVVAANLEYDARRELFVSLLGKSQTFHNCQRIGDIVTRATSDMIKLDWMIILGIDLTADSLLSVIVPLIFIGFIQIELLLAPLIFTAVFAVAMSSYGKKLGPVSGRMNEQSGRMNAGLAEAFSGIELVKSTGQERQEELKFEANAKRWRDLFVQRGEIQARYLPPIFFTVALAGALLHGLSLVSNGQLTVGDLVAYLGLVEWLRGAVFTFSFSAGHILLGWSSAGRILTLIKEETELDENPTGHRGTIQGEIAFENVSFDYGANPVLKNISFHARPGETIAIVGMTGSGKSTLTKLVNRIYDVNAGRVLVDGVDVREWNLQALRSQISTIEQDVLLFSRSIAENIAFGLGRQVDRQTVEQAAQEAQAHDFISNFKDGYKTLVGERGVNLSGGQRQRLAIARALLTDPRILILDDSTSAIDSATEDEIQKAIRRVQKGRTTLLITHRLSQIRQADKILILRGGELFDQGTHDELLEHCELYRRIFAV